MRWLDGITDLMDGFGWTPGIGDGQEGRACCSSWGRKELDMTKRLNRTEPKDRRNHVWIGREKGVGDMGTLWTNLFKFSTTLKPF